MNPKGNHSLFDCFTLRKSLDAPTPEGTGKKWDKEDDEEGKEGPQGFQQPANVVNVILGSDSCFSKHAQKLTLCEILSIELAI